MKSASQFDLSLAWWVKERPEEIEKDPATRKFDAALKELEAALGKTRGGVDAGTHAGLQKLGEALEDAAAKLVKVVDALAKPLKGERRKRLDNTSAALDRALSGALRKALDAVEIKGDDGEDNPGQFGSAEAHAAYLSARLRKAKAGQMFFAVALPTGKVADLRMALHVSSKGPSLVTKLKAATGAKKLTYGVAGTEEVAESVNPTETVGSGTLVLALEGPPISGLAKRLRDMFKALGVRVFAKVKVIQPGGVAEQAGMDEPSEALEDLPEGEGEAIAAEGAAPAAEPAATGTGARRAALVQKMREIGGEVLTQPEKLRQVITPLLREAGELVRAAGAQDSDPALDRADKILTAIATRLQSVDGGAASSARAEEARAETPVGTVQFARARLLWTKSRGQLRAQVERLVADIIDSCGSDPDYASWKAEAPGLLDHVDALDDELDEVLERYDAAETLEERQALLTEAEALIADYEENLSGDFFRLAEGDTDLPPVRASVALTALGAIGKMVAQGQKASA